jgi:DNA-directed RNA polymerase specialized sigma24 family protein
MGSLTTRIQHLRSPDVRQREEAARVIWDHFEGRLRSLVRRHLDNRIRRREDEQDILQSMYASFCHGQLEGKACPGSRQELWKLLVRITLCKVVNTANRHLAARRDVRRERAPAGARDDSAHFPRWMLDHVDRMQAGPDEKLVAIEEFERLLQALPEDLRRIILWKLDGFTNAEVAAMLGRTVRCVELKLQLIRKRLASRPAAEASPG